jgi:hypothetical protein
MQRIPNPVSDPSIFIRVFRDLYDILHNRIEFGLDDISQAMITRNNVTSQGAIGEEALRRSTRKDRSRDPIYNQSKMYAELFRTLGWIQSMPTSKLTYTFSLLGEHIATAYNPAPLMHECLLGIAYPNEVLGVQSGQTVRVIGTILLAMDILGSLSRDEMIAGPMSIADDTDPQAFGEMIKQLNKCRNTPGELDNWINSIAETRGISRSPTMENYTRFPIAVFPWTGWGIKRGRGVLYITEGGKAMAYRLKEAIDFRLAHFNELPDDVKPAFIRWTFYRMLERAGYNVQPVNEVIEESIKVLSNIGINTTKEIYFSPFQQLSYETINRWTPELVALSGTAKEDTSETIMDLIANGGPVERSRTALIFDMVEKVALRPEGTDAIITEINSLLKNTGSVDGTIDALMSTYAQANKDVFYPLVANLFCILGFNCRLSRGGQNYERADAIILDERCSIPIEIKSPGEESEISVKGIRQALENKVVLLSRKSYPTDRGTTSLVVGFNPPNERSEVHELIEDIDKVFDIKVGVIDFVYFGPI